ncbi:MAG: hypothetical protein RLP15_08140 [Cryomorphaceae bacterium]
MLLAETKSTIYELKEGILISRLKPDVEMSLEDVKQNAEVRSSLPISFPIPFLMDLRKMKGMSFNAIMATSSQEDIKKFSAAAILIDKLEHKIIAREAHRLHSAANPLKTFEDEEKAFAWIKRFV